MENEQIGKRSFLSLGTDKVSYVRSEGNYLDPKGLQEEKSRLLNERERARDHITRTLYPQLPDRRSKNYWDRINYKEDELFNTENSLEEKIRSRPEGETRDAHYLSYILHGASELLKFKNFEQQKKLAEKHDFSYLFGPYLQLSEFVYTSTIHSKIGGVSLKDVIDNPEITPSSIYRYVMESDFVHSRLTHAKILEENQTPLTLANPNFTKQTIHTAAGLSDSFYYMTPEYFETLLRNFLPQQQGTEKEIIATAREMVNRINRLRQNVYMTILNPNSPEFPSLKDMVEKYLLEEDGNAQTSAILGLGLIDEDKICTAYRKTKELAGENNENSPFYKLLQSSIKQYIEEVPQELGVLTQDDLPMFIDGDKAIEDEAAPTLEDLRKVTISIFNKASHKAYRSEESDNEEIDLANMTSPNSIRVEFPKGHPNIFNIYFYYENEQGESTTLELNFDTRKNVFDWKPFAPDTSDPEMKQLRDAGLIAAQSILSYIHQYVEDEYQQKQQEREAGTQTQRPAQGRKIRSEEPYVPRQKLERQERLRPLTPIQEILQSEMPIFAQPKGIKNEIVLPEDQYLFDVMKGLAPSDQKEIVEGIQNYNEIGVGTFRMLKALGNEGQRLYALRVNCGPRGGSRVLLQESDSEETSPNIRKFQIVDIGYRKDIYRKRGL